MLQDPRDLLDQCEADQRSPFLYNCVRREHLGRKPQVVGAVGATTPSFVHLFIIGPLYIVPLLLLMLFLLFVGLGELSAKH